MANAEFVGSALYAQWIAYNSGGTALGTVLLSTDARNFNYRPSLSFVDATAGADAATRRLAYMKDGQCTVSTLMQSDMGTVVMVCLAEGVAGTLTWGEAGTTPTYPKHVMAAISMGYSSTTPYNNVVTLDATFQQNGVRVDSVYS